MQKKPYQVLAAGLYGSALEWYDFLLYAYFASLFAKLFFPTHDQFTSLLASFSVFAMGFLVRPLGALILGHIGDKIGRRTALLATIITITGSSFFMAILPTYEQIGILAPIFLIFLRMLQGIAISGELNSAAAYIIEHVSIKHRGFAGSLVMAIALLGIILAAAVATILMTVLTSDQLNTWGWRMAYVIGGVLGIFGIYLRMRSKESPEFVKAANKLDHLPLKTLFSEYSKSLLAGIFLTSIMAVGNYLLIGFVTIYVTQINPEISLQSATLINLIAMLVYTVFQPYMGYLSDRFGRKPIFLSGLMEFTIFIGPIFWLLNQPNFLSILVGEALLGFCLAPIGGLIPTILAEKFPSHVRTSGSLLAYNISLAIFGGTTPAIALALVHYTNNNYSPLLYVGLCLILTFYAWRYTKETRPSHVV